MSLLRSNEMREKYFNDSKFHAMVDTMVGWMEVSYTHPSELAKMTVMACEIYAERNFSPVMVILKEEKK
jgi:hypothetical protein